MQVLDDELHESICLQTFGYMACPATSDAHSMLVLCILQPQKCWCCGKWKSWHFDIVLFWLWHALTTAA